MIFDPRKITTSWFFSSPPPLLLFIGIYIKGDCLVLLPFLLLICALSLYSAPIGLLVYIIYFTIRGLGEMIYWLLQQFGPKTYRPWDYGFTQLNNEGIYIIYQLTSMIHVIIGITISILLIQRYI